MSESSQHELVVVKDSDTNVGVKRRRLSKDCLDQPVCKVSNQTSSDAPEAVNARIFVGNLNTFHVNKVDLEQIFEPYGKIAGISMHKGYAFVQFTDAFDARNACYGEDMKLLASQVIDCNLVSEPRPHQLIKRNSTKDENGEKLSKNKEKSDENLRVETIFTFIEENSASNDHDILVCGNCRSVSRSIFDFIDHKRNSSCSVVEKVCSNNSEWAVNENEDEFKENGCRTIMKCNFCNQFSTTVSKCDELVDHLNLVHDLQLSCS